MFLQNSFVVNKLKLNKKRYSSLYARLSNVRCISEYSMTVDREVVNDRTCARYLINEYINDNVDFDLKKGIDSFINKSELIKDEGRLHPLCKWACAQEGDELGQIVSGAEFASSRGTMRLIASTLITHNPKFVTAENAWTVVAVKVGDVILLSEKTKKYGRDDDLSSYSGFKFEQYMTSDKPGGEAAIDNPVDNRPTFKKMMRSDLISEGQSIGICCTTDVDALDGDSSIELQTRPISRDFSFFPSLKIVLQAEFSDIHTTVIGYKTANNVLKKVTKIPITNFKPILNRADENSLAFLFTVLDFARNIMVSKAACEITYDPSKGAVEFNDFPKEEAMNLLTPDFKKKFNLGD